MHNGNGVRTSGDGYGETQGASPPQAIYLPDRKVSTVLITLNSIALTATTVILAFVILPGLVSLSARLQIHREETDRQAETTSAKTRTMEESRKRLLHQQAESVSRQEKLKALTERNLRLADELNRKLTQKDNEDQ